MIKRFYGYRIIQSLPVGNVTFYIGYNKNDLNQYATFFKRNGDRNYSWMRSFNDLYSAQKDIIDRAHREIPLIDLSLEKEKTANVNKT